MTEVFAGANLVYKLIKKRVFKQCVCVIRIYKPVCLNA